MRIRNPLSGPPPWNRSWKSYRAVDKLWNRFGPAVPYPDGEKSNIELASYLSDATLVTVSVGYTADRKGPKGRRKRRRHSNKTRTKKPRKFPRSWQSTLPVSRHKLKPHRSFPRMLA